MTVRDNIEVVRRFGEALTNRDWAAFDDLVADDCEWTDVPSGQTLRGRDELIAGCKAFTTAFPDFSVESLTIIGQGDLVANEWNGRGTNDGRLTRPDGAIMSRRAGHSNGRASASSRFGMARSSATGTTSIARR